MFLGNNGKVAAVQDADAVQHHVFAAHQCNGLVAVPGGAVAPVGAVFGVGGVAAGQHIDEGTGVVHVAAVDETLAVDHDIVLVSGVEQAVGKVGVAVVLEPGIEVHFRLIVVSALAHHGLVAIPVVQVCPGSPDDAVGVDAEVDAALETDGVALKITCWYYHGAAAGLTGSRGGVGIHESVSAEFMLTRFLGLGVTVGGQWLIVDSPDVDDGAELNLAGIFRVQLGGGIRFYF
jgi:hypothetical protein